MCPFTPLWESILSFHCVESKPELSASTFLYLVSHRLTLLCYLFRLLCSFRLTAGTMCLNSFLITTPISIMASFCIILLLVSTSEDNKHCLIEHLLRWFLFLLTHDFSMALKPHSSISPHSASFSSSPEDPSCLGNMCSLFCLLRMLLSLHWWLKVIVSLGCHCCHYLDTSRWNLLIVYFDLLSTYL